MRQHVAPALALLFVILVTASAFAGEVPQTLPGGFSSFREPKPTDKAEWRQRRKELRSKLWTLLLGDEPPAMFTPEPTFVKTEQRDGYTLRKFTFGNGVGDTVRGYVLIPEGRAKPGPGVLYNHWHAGQYERGKRELLIRAFAGFDDGHRKVPGEALVREGYLVLGIDAYGFGERLQKRWQGPGKKNFGREGEHALSKIFLLQGRSLWGMRVRDDLLALRYLASREDVDADRIAAMGISMGAMRSWWAAALSDQIDVCVAVACLPRLQNLIATGQLNFHGIYYYVPGMLAERIDAEAVIGLIAPRALLTLTGTDDPTSPIGGVRLINDFQRHLYRKIYGKPDNFRAEIYPGVGHMYTPAMWRETTDWIEEHL